MHINVAYVDFIFLTYCLSSHFSLFYISVLISFSRLYISTTVGHLQNVSSNFKADLLFLKVHTIKCFTIIWKTNEVNQRIYRKIEVVYHHHESS